MENSGDATLDALRDMVTSHGLGAVVSRLTVVCREMSSATMVKDAEDNTASKQWWQDGDVLEATQSKLKN